MSSIIKRRAIDNNFLLEDIHPVLQRIYQARGIHANDEIEYELSGLLPFADLLNIDQAAHLLSQALAKQQHILIVGDFDADGATSTALAVRALRMMGAKKVSFLVPNRFEYGYGLTPEIVNLAAKQKPDLIVTVDNGISSLDGVEKAKQFGIDVLITDHHLQGDELPDANVIVNPNQDNDQFASKNLAGVGVCFYVMLALRSYLKELNWFSKKDIAVPNMATLLDIVALGTVADVVPLDKNNRILVQQGLRRIQANKCVPGINALLNISKRSLTKLTAADLGFAVGPRLNAAGRLHDMSLGIECLLTDDIEQANLYAEQLDALNRERRHIENEMKQQAMEALQTLKLDKQQLPVGLCLFDETWHQGVIGILASRIKDQYFRPVIAFANAGDDTLKGSARSVKGVHIRDILDAIAKQYPDLVSKFGGHAMAAGLSLEKSKYFEFSKAFAKEVQRYLNPYDLRGEILTDGPLSIDDFSLLFAEQLNQAGPWGQAFPEPIFDGEFIVLEQHIVGRNHLRLLLQHPDGSKTFNAIKFNVDLQQWPNHRCQRICAAYKLDINEFNGFKNVQLVVEHLENV